LPSNIDEARRHRDQDRATASQEIEGLERLLRQ
jgi:hypothetical protein